MMRLISLAAAFALALGVTGHPTTSSLHGASIQRRAVDVNKFRLQADAAYIPSAELSSDADARAKEDADYVAVATAFVKETVPDLTFRLVDGHYVGTNGIAHVHFRQTVHDLDVDNSDINVNVGRDGKVFSYGSSFYAGELPTEGPSGDGRLATPLQALRDVNEVLGLSLSIDGASAKPTGQERYTFEGASGTTQNPNAELVYFRTSDEKLVLSWRVETDIYTNWLLSYADARDTKQVLGVVDYSNDATYRVYPWGVNDPSEGVDRVLVTDPWDSGSSEFTWHGDGSSTYQTTRGNNGVAGANWDRSSGWERDPRPVSANLTFDYPYSLTNNQFRSYANASVTQLFFTANMFHDLLYLLGFNEQAGNFEFNVNGQGGQGNDFVILNAQDGSGTNNAQFATPPDGQPGRMLMYMWDTANPQRDCSFEAGVVIHEYTHGLSNRLTGGPSNTRCLNALESGGMGEGWSDFFATAIRTKANDTRETDYAMGAWVFNNQAGIRRYVYSTSMTTNPHVYNDITSLNGVHAIGTVWATMLYELMWNLIDVHGNTGAIRPTFDDNGVPTDGRYLSMKLVTDGMALQPCNPTFIQARDAIIDADVALTGGANACPIWQAFAKRGLGDGARRGAQSFEVPDNVC